MLNVKVIIVSTMMNHCAGTVQMREESESRIRKWEEMWFKTRAEDGERGDSSDVWCRRAAATHPKHKLSCTGFCHVDQDCWYCWARGPMGTKLKLWHWFFHWKFFEQFMYWVLQC